MMDPKNDVSCIDRKLLHFLEYTRSGHWSDDPIPLSLLQAFGDVIFDDILMTQQEIHDVVDQ